MNVAELKTKLDHARDDAEVHVLVAEAIEENEMQKVWRVDVWSDEDFEYVRADGADGDLVIQVIEKEQP